MKHLRLLVFPLFFCVILIVLFIYFRPLNATEVFPNFDNINSVNIMVRFFDNKEQEFRNHLITEESKLQSFLNILSSTKYKRALGRTNINSQSNAHDILLYHSEDSNYILINDKGYLVVLVNQKHKKYKIQSSKSNAIFELIDAIK